MPQRLELTLGGTPEDAAMARRALLDLLGDAVAVEVARDAVLLTSELVANAVIHAPGPAWFRASLDAETVRVEIDDTSTVVPVPAEGDSRPTDGGGYGLRMVSQLSAVWGVEVSSWGKTVWFVLRRQLHG